MNPVPKIKILDYYQNELFKSMPEDMFNLIDEAYFNKQTTVKIPKNLIEEFEKNKTK